MRVKVTKDDVTILEKNQVHEEEININEIEFEFSEEYNQLTKKAIFHEPISGIKIEKPILNNKCIIPNEVLKSYDANIQLRVYGYETEIIENESKIKIRYSPSFTTFPVEKGSYITGANGSEEITPSQFEQYSEALNQGLEELEEAIESIGVDTSYAREMGNYAKEQGDNAKEIADSYSTTISAMQRDISSNTSNINENIRNINNLKNRASVNETNIEEINNNLSNYSLISETGSQLVLNLDSSSYKIKALLKDKNGNTIYTSNEIDLPLESVVVSGTYDSINKKIVLTLESGSTIDIPVGSLINGLQSQITSTNKLNSDLVDDSLSANKFVTSAEKTAWNNKSDFSGNYNDLSNKPTIPTQLSQLSDDSTHKLVSETEKENWNNKLEQSALSDYVKNTDYANSNKAGVIIPSNTYATSVSSSSGVLFTQTKSYQDYTTGLDGMFIGKGTLENVLNARIGDIATAIDGINREVI